MTWIRWLLWWSVLAAYAAMSTAHAVAVGHWQAAVITGTACLWALANVVKTTRRRRQLLERLARELSSTTRHSIVDSTNEIRTGVQTCRHLDAVPVDSVLAERVAWWCAKCETQLPAEWEPRDPDPLMGLSLRVAAEIASQRTAYARGLASLAEKQDR